MTLITPPTDDEDEEPVGKYIPEYIPPFGLTPYEDRRRVELFLNVPNWKCPCGLTLHGRVKNCVRCGKTIRR